jgi:TolB-like protein/thioredoxin-like negative regulator of GroEL
MDPLKEDSAPAGDKEGEFASDAFLSYASADAEAAKQVCARLEASGLRIWMAPRDVPAGAHYADALVRAINASRSLLLILSENSVDSSHVSKEVERASSKRKPIVAIRLDAAPLTPAFEYFLSESQWVDARDGLDAAMPRLTDDLRRLVSGARVGTAARAERPIPPVPAKARTRAPMLALALAAVAVLILGGWWLGESQGWWARMAGGTPTTPAATANSVAVLPFTDLSEKKDQEYFSDGLSDELIDLLGKIPNLRVPARTSSFYFKGKPSTLPEIGKVLNVSHVLEGSVRKSGTALRISAELVNVADDTRVWSETYDRTLDDVFKVQDDIANAVVTALKVTMLGDVKARAAPTNNSEAHLQYLRGLEWARSQSGSYEEAITALRKAVELDPAFADAWVALAATRVGGFVAVGTGDYESVRREAVDDLQRALALNPQLAAAHSILAEIYYQMDWTPSPARAELERALALDPKDPLAIWMKGYMANCEGRFDEAIAMHKESLDIDPLQADNYRQIGNADYRAGRLDAGIAVLTDALKRVPAARTIHYRLGLLLLAQHKLEAALTEFSAEEFADFRLLGIPLALDKLGRREEADKILAQALTHDSVLNGAAYQLAIVYANRGDADRAFQWLERGVRQRDAGMLWMKYDPILRPLSQDPRFKMILEKMHQS